jgi:hypothetical protein
MHRGIQQGHLAARQRATHGAGLGALVLRIADLHKDFGLQKAAAKRKDLGAVVLIDDFRTERPAHANEFAQLKASTDRFSVFMNHQPQRSGERAESGHADALQLRRQPHCMKARIVVNKETGVRVPGREKAALGMFAPAREKVFMCTSQGIKPIQYMFSKGSHGITLVYAHHELGLGRCA